jgi:hypothetical protein
VQDIVNGFLAFDFFRTTIPHDRICFCRYGNSGAALAEEDYYQIAVG